MVTLFITSALIILYTVYYYRVKKKTEEKRAERRKIKQVEQEFLNREKSVLCEDGVTRIYKNSMFGILEDVLADIKGNPEPRLKSTELMSDGALKIHQRMLKESNMKTSHLNGRYAIEGSILSELKRHFGINSIEIEYEYPTISYFYFVKAKWFSKNGLELTSEEVIAYAKKREQERVKRNPGLLGPGLTIIRFYEINNNFYLSIPFKHFDFFNGKINEVEYVKGEPQDDAQAQKPQSVNKEVVTQQYSLNDGLPPSLDSIVPDSKLFKRDMSGLIQYFKDMPNMERIYNEFTHSIRNGYSVENYLHEANLMDDLEIREIAGKGFSTIAGFLTDMLSVQENKELRKDLEACKKAESILLKPEES